MINVLIDYSDGCYTMREVPEGDARGVKIPETIWRAYCAHLDADHVYQMMIRMLDERSHAT